MLKQYLKQSFFLLKENKLIGFISILGTALAIAMIMVVVIIVRTQYASFAPETKRERMLIVQWLGLQSRENERWQSNGAMSYKTAKECFKSLDNPEAISVIALRKNMLIAKPAAEKSRCRVRECDDEFWKIFDFVFVKGEPFNKADFNGGFTKIVISERTARSLYGTIDIIGEIVFLNYVPFTVCGVVKNISPLAEYAYADAWIPLTSTNVINDVWGNNGEMGQMNVLILAHSQKDFNAIRNEAEVARKKYVESLVHWDILYRDQPDTYFVSKLRQSANLYPNTKNVVRIYLFSLLVLLIIPAVNLSGITLSRMRKRISEIGLRKAFGATKKEIVMQVLSENLIYTLIGGILGLIFSYISCFLLTEMLFNVKGNVGINIVTPDLLFDLGIFIFAFLFCLILNLLSALLPAWRVTRVNIIDSLYQR